MPNQFLRIHVLPIGGQLLDFFTIAGEFTPVSFIIVKPNGKEDSYEARRVSLSPHSSEGGPIILDTNSL